MSSVDRLSAILGKAAGAVDDPPVEPQTTKCRCVLEDTNEKQDKWFDDCYKANGNPQAMFEDSDCKKADCDFKKCSATYICRGTESGPRGSVKLDGECQKIQVTPR